MVEELNRNPFQDFLGYIYMNLELGDKGKGQFFTPYNISSLMGNISLDNAKSIIDKNGFISINDSAAGAGSTLIAALEHLYSRDINYQNSAWLVAQDLSEIAILECYIQLSLIGAAGVVQQGDTLTMEYNYALHTPMTIIEPLWTARWMQNKLPCYPCYIGSESGKQEEKQVNEIDQLQLDIA